MVAKHRHSNKLSTCAYGQYVFVGGTQVSPERGADDDSGPKASATFANMAALTATGSTAPTLRMCKRGHEPCTAAGCKAGVSNAAAPAVD